MQKSLNYSAEICFLVGNESKVLTCQSEIKNVSLNSKPEYRGILWFPNVKLTKEEEHVLGVQQYLPDSRKHHTQYILLCSKQHASESFTATAHAVLSWFEKKTVPIKSSSSSS